MNVSGLLFRAWAHAVAGAVVIGLALLFTFLGYIGLLAWAVLTGTGLGGPLAGIGMLVVAFVAAVVAAAAVFLPVTVVTEWLCTKMLRWSRVAQIPVATLLCLVELLVVSISIASLREADVAFAVKVGVIGWLVLLVPLGVYWWVLQFHDGARWVAGAVWARVRRNRTSDAAGQPTV